jgi:hypothetical protein
MHPHEPVIDPMPADQTPHGEVIDDPDVPLQAPVDDVYEPITEAPDVTD